MLNELFQTNPISGMLLSIGCFWMAQVIYDKLKWTILQPVLTSGFVIIALLMIADIPYEDYNDQNIFLNFVLPMTAVVLAIPLYRNLPVLKKHMLPILAGIIAGTAVSMAALIITCKLMGTDVSIIISMIPKSATNPIAVETSRIIGGIPSLTAFMVVIAGMYGSIFGPELMKLFRIKNAVAKGIAIGSMSHAIGTVRAFKEGEVEGSMSGLAMALAGMLTAILSPIFALFI